jgi:3-deoxy-D-manno-octulosonate 8-phosphate phosphatase (KDO 8-P phosphatase)
MTSKFSLDKIEAFIFDFDGVLTNNLVYIGQDGQELVSCSRSDGLAFDVLRKLNKPMLILSTEKSLVVAARAKKLNIPCVQGVDDKVEALKKFAINGEYNLEKILFVGNDINDSKAMKICGFSVCPSDSHYKIKQIADIVLESRGGQGVVRELVENIFEIDLLEILYN